MLDIKLIRENPSFVRQNLAMRQEEKYLNSFDRLLESDKKARILIKETEELKHKRNLITSEIKRLLAEKKDASAKMNEAKSIPAEIKEKEKELNLLKEECQRLLESLPNLLDESVPFGKDDSENREIKKLGKIPSFDFELKHHGQLAVELNGADFERAVKISGTGFYFLKGELALLEQALMKFGIDILLKKGFELIIPPFLMRRKPYSKVTDLNDFENVMYKIENQDLYLIATSEHPLVSMYMDEIIEEKRLPVKFIGYSPCFRKEVGKHGLDERGLFRVHQFNKIEQVIFCRPEDSKKFHEELLNNSEQLMKLLGIPCRVVNVCTGDIGVVASKKYDVEGYSPREKKYIEVMSCSNCTDFQSRGLNIKFFDKNEKKFVHTLNNTMVATARMLRLVLENFQTKKGTVKIPKALLPYMNGIKELKPKK
ncbi:serine--tRNA ligase [Candidatus Micrarchaeota archaeon]|nr:serine--tRNA ligase [Candidatus Micrarchaeota archaeon]